MLVQRLEPMPPGTYLRKRREACGLAIADVAAHMAATAEDAAGIVEILTRIEAGELVSPRELPHARLIETLGHAIRFDAEVYWALVSAVGDPGKPVPPVCRACACSWMDPCIDAHHDPCAWVDPPQPEPLCTHCEEADAGPVPPVPGAGREHSHAL